MRARIDAYLDKWFKSHKGEVLTIHSFTHIENIVGLLTETIKVQDSLKEMHGSSELCG